MGNEKEPVKMRRTMQAFLKKLGGHKGSKQRKNFPQLVQAVIEADNEVEMNLPTFSDICNIIFYLLCRQVKFKKTGQKTMNNCIPSW